MAAEPDGSEILGLLVILFGWNCCCCCTFGRASDYRVKETRPTRR